MSKRKTAGERIAFAQEFYQLGLRQSESLKRRINAAIRRAKAEAWDEGFGAGMSFVRGDSSADANPYRGRAKR